jgi:RNA polymerase sigma-70 factor (ECF subfamily)
LGDHVQPSNVGAEPANAASPVALDVGALTRGMTRGDEGAYRSFYDAYFNRLFRYLLVATRGNEEAARDALQAALVRVVRHIKVFPDDAQFWNWLALLARSALADENRRHRRYFSFLDRFTRHTEIEHAGRNDNHADERLRVLLQCGIASLPPDEQQLVGQMYFARHSVREIADELHTTEKAVESKLSRVRRKLKDAVLAELKHESPT